MVNSVRLLPGARVQSLIEELRSLKPPGMAKKKIQGWILSCKPSVLKLGPIEGSLGDI